MSKKYFAKYLPVEGEIKKDDWFIDGKTLYKAFAYDFKDENGNEVLNIPKEPAENFSKVKLFLCTRDIRMGDDFYTSDGKKVSFTDAYREFQPNNFKAVGEISPEATWVKEGDEFDEEEWKFCYGNGNPEIELGKDKVPFDFPYCIKILNPSCKHFH